MFRLELQYFTQAGKQWTLDTDSVKIKQVSAPTHPIPFSF